MPEEYHSKDSAKMETSDGLGRWLHMISVFGIEQGQKKHKYPGGMAYIKIMIHEWDVHKNDIWQ